MPNPGKKSNGQMLMLIPSVSDMLPLNQFTIFIEHLQTYRSNERVPYTQTKLSLEDSHEHT